MKHLNLYRIAASICVIGAISLPASAQNAELWPTKPYSATMTVEADRELTQGKMYIDGKDMRVEIDTPQGPVVQIIDRDSGEAFTLTNMDGRKMAMKVNAAKAMAGVNFASVSELPKKEGSKRIDWKKCNVYRFEAGLVCLTKDNIILESVEVKTGDTTTFTDVKIGKQNASLFKVPADYQIMDMSGLSGMMGGKDGISGDSFKDTGSIMDQLGDMIGVEGLGSADMDALGNEPDTEESFDDALRLMLEMGGQNSSEIMGAMNDIKANGIDGNKQELTQEEKDYLAYEKKLTEMARENPEAALAHSMGVSIEEMREMTGGRTALSNLSPDEAEARVNANMQADIDRLKAGPGGKLFEPGNDLESKQRELDALNATIQGKVEAGIPLTEAEKAQYQTEAAKIFGDMFGDTK